MATAVDERANLPSRFMRQLRELTREFGRQNLVRRYSPGVKLFQAANLIRLETGSISDNVLDNRSPISKHDFRCLLKPERAVAD